MASFRSIFTSTRHLRRILTFNFSSQASSDSEKRPVVLSGIQPTGIPHLGNYLGAIRPWVTFQNDDQCRPLVSIVDLHALTGVGQNTSVDVGHRVFEMAATLLACGIDPSQGTVLFQQSEVRGHTELAWILSCLCPLSRVESQPQWRERLATWQTSDLTLGLLSYPVLQAADILIYRATHVPVGEDQVKHLELARTLVDRFHRRFCPSDSQYIFPRPVTVLAELGDESRVCSLRRPDKKMSKSDPDPASRIELTDSDEAVRKKLRSSVTDSVHGGVTFDPVARPGVANLMRIEAALSGEHLTQVIDRLSGSSKVQLKDHVTETVLTWLRPIRSRLATLLTDEADAVRVALDQGNRLAQSEADRTMAAVRSAMRLCP